MTLSMNNYLHITVNCTNKPAQEQQPMAQARLRPRLRIISTFPQADVLDRIARKLTDEACNLEGQVVQEHAFIRIPENRQHYWSPELHVWVREQDGETIVYGVMGPKPRIWTMFMFFYTGVITSAFFGSSYGIIQLILGMEAPFLWSIPLGLLVVALVFGAARYGQFRGSEQMGELRGFLEEAVNG